MDDAVNRQRYFVDTWGWLVLANSGDPNFGDVASLRAGVRHRPGALVTTDYVLDETFTRLFASVAFPQARRFAEAILGSARLGFVHLERIGEERFQQAWAMRLRYRDKPRISFTDLTSFAVMKELGLTDVLTGDAHFEQAGLGFRKLPR